MIVLFDGICNLCNGYVNFVIKRAPQTRIRFAALQSAAGQKILTELGLPIVQSATIIAVEGKRYSMRSTAILRILRNLSGMWPAFYIFIIIPAFLRDGIYNWVAQNRYGWFGKRGSCRLPTTVDKEHFIS